MPDDHLPPGTCILNVGTLGHNLPPSSSIFVPETQDDPRDHGPSQTQRMASATVNPLPCNWPAYCIEEIKERRQLLVLVNFRPPGLMFPRRPYPWLMGVFPIGLPAVLSGG